MFFFDAVQEYARNKDDLQRITGKTKKVAQLTQKLYNLTMLEERLMARKKYLEAMK